MFGLIAFVPLLGALSAAALSPEHMRLFPRQIEQSFPQACQSQCTGAIKIYNACISSDFNTCLTVCKQAQFNDFIGCFQCVLDNEQGVTQSEWSQLQSAVDQIKSGCSQAGQSVTGGLQALSQTSTPSAAGGESLSATASGAAASASSAAGAGITIAASGASAIPSAASASANGVTAAVGSAAGQATSAGGSVAGSASSAAASAAPASGALPVTSFVGGFVALISVAAGMAIAF
ncbi:uncharacterized protein L201_000484 [Kwoniella dendrophila CBS 6074]|uniref:Extracellular membrane protein CFEM domain-containing protein n=1 Tax=Kwoniella dendrophila CBS 6074 TaxID=1295534 RepID=A0AAX4JJN1_9TREE